VGEPVADGILLSLWTRQQQSLHSVALYGSNLNEASTGVLVSSLLEVNSAHVTGTSASTTSGEGMVKWELCLTLVYVVVTAVLLKIQVFWGIKPYRLVNS
jgi:hypothetical protein